MKYPGYCREITIPLNLKEVFEHLFLVSIPTVLYTLSDKQAMRVKKITNQVILSSVDVLQVFYQILGTHIKRTDACH